MNLKSTLLLIALFFFQACSPGSDRSKTPGEVKVFDPLEIEMMGTYQALLSPINKEVSGHLNGSLTLVRENDEFVADVRLSGGPPSAMHIQSIHVGGRCPEKRDDRNGDGFLDGEEGALVYDQVILPLDDDLSSQWLGLGTFPVTDAYGYYFWSRTTSFEKIMKDLHEEDINLRDNYVKLVPTKPLNLLGKVIVIKGVSTEVELPESVKGHGRETPHQSIPIACGVIRKLTHIPGFVDRDTTDIPVPASGEEVGGSGGYDDGAVFPVGGTTGGNYGEEDEVETTDNATDYDDGNTT